MSAARSSQRIRIVQKIQCIRKVRNFGSITTEPSDNSRLVHAIRERLDVYVLHDYTHGVCAKSVS